MSGQRGRVRSAAPGGASDLGREGASFVCAYATEVRPGETRSSEAWARQLWEGAPAVLRWFMTLGWRSVLRLRLGPHRSPDHILGWAITESLPAQTVCRSQSSFL